MYGSVLSRFVFSSRPLSYCLLRCGRNHKSANVDNKLYVRLASEHDFHDVVKASEGVYDGRDYLPFVFHQWLKVPGKYMFVGELHGKIIAFLTANVIDGGQTIYCQSIRINQEYRRKEYSYQMFSEVLNQVQRFSPGASRVRYMTLESNRKIKNFSGRVGFKCVMKKLLSGFPVPSENVAELKRLYKDENQLHELKVQDAVTSVLEERRFDHIIPNKIMLVLKEPHQLVPSNADRLFKENDKMFADVTTEQLRHLTSRSFSHGRLLHHVKQQTWICNIYANERDAFKAHLIQQLMTAIEQLEKTGRKTGLEVVFSPNLDFDARQVFQDVLGSSQARKAALLSV